MRIADETAKERVRGGEWRHVESCPKQCPDFGHPIIAVDHQSRSPIRGGSQGVGVCRQPADQVSARMDGARVLI